MEKIKVALIAVVLGIYASSASAGLDQVMRDRFNAMVSSYPAGVVQGENVNTITGGRFRVRMNPQSFQIASFRAPSIRGGCGGIDLFGGAFSLISADQLVQMLENIAASAASFFFMIAIRSISDSIGNVMEKLQEQLNMLNQGMMDSCEIGKTIANGLAGELGMLSENEAGIMGSGTEGDNATSWWSGLQSSMSWLRQRNPNVAREIMPGNVVYRALKAVMGGAFGGNEATLMQMMSVTGTIVVCVPGQDGCPNKAADPVAGSSKTTTEEMSTEDKPPLIGLKTLLEGAAPPVSAAYLYQCNDDSMCLDPTSSSTPTTFVGQKEVLDTLIQGPSDATGTGLIGKWRNATGTLTPEEMVIDRAGHRYLDVVKGLARFNEGEARRAYTEIKELVALEWSGPLLIDIMGYVIAAAEKSNKAGKAQLILKLTIAKSRIEEEYIQLITEAERNSGKAYEQYKERLQVLRAKSTPRV